MALSKQFEAPNGATLSYHRVVRAEVTVDGIVVHAQGWVSEQACAAGNPPLWTHYERLPLGGLLTTLETQLAASSATLGGAAVLESSSMPLERARSLRWAEIKDGRQARDDAPIEVDGIPIDADAQSRQDIMGAIMAMQLTGQTSRMWRCADNVMRELTLTQIVEAGTAIASRRQQLVETSAALYEQIQSAADAAAVAAVVWPV